MKRVLKSAMTNVNGLLCYEDNLFSGIAYEILDHDRVHPFLIENGLVVSPYLSPLIDDQPDFLHVDMTETMDEYDIPEYQGIPFTGIAYEFHDEFCNREVKVSRGATLLDTWWDKYGVLTSYERYVADCGEIYQWYSENALQRCRISTSFSYSGALVFKEDGRLQMVTADRGFLRRLNEISSASPYFPVTDLSFFLTYRCSEKMSIDGNDFDDELIGKMCSARMFEVTEQLEITDSAITHRGLHALKQCPRMKRISIEENDKARRRALKPAMKNNGAVKIEFI